MNDSFPDSTELTRGIEPKHLDTNFHCFDEVESTMDRAWELIPDHRTGETFKGRVVVADRQTAGRGRQGRNWFSPGGSGIWCSILLQPSLPRHHLFPHLTVIGALAIVEMIHSSYELEPRIRWPNDVVLPSSSSGENVKKVAGVLVETRQIGNDESSLAVVGCGINVNVPADEFPEQIRDEATSLMAESDEKFNRTELLRDFLVCFDRNLSRLYRGDHDEIDSDWTRYSAVLNRRVRVRVEGETVEGTVADVSLEQGLTLRMDEGGYRILEPSHVEMLRLIE